MARSTQVVLTDDIDGGTASQTIAFGFEGVDFEIDLNDENADEFREAMQVWSQNARRVGGRRRKGTTATDDAHKAEVRKIRAWAKENGFNVSDRGRIHSDVIEAYRQAR